MDEPELSARPRDARAFLLVALRVLLLVGGLVAGVIVAAASGGCARATDPRPPGPLDLPAPPASPTPPVLPVETPVPPGS